MEEKVLIKSEQYNVKKLLIAFVLIGFLLSLVAFISIFSTASEEYNSLYETYLQHQEKDSWECSSADRCYICRLILYKYSSETDFMIQNAFEDLFFLPAIVFTFIGVLIFVCLNGYELTVTDKRIYGKIAGGKRVDLPVDSVSSTATIRLLKGVSISTSSGRISFHVIKNADEIYSVISNLLIERQQAMANSVVATVAPKSDEADQLKKYKDLLDQGVISQEEFDAKKKQLLGL